MFSLGTIAVFVDGKESNRDHNKLITGSEKDKFRFVPMDNLV